MNDGFGLIVAFCVIAGIIHGILKTRNKQPILTDNEPINEDLIEDSEGDGLFFSEPLFPPEFEDIED